MPDATMCNNENCGLKESCYRFNADPSFWQYYNNFIPFFNDCDELECDFYYPMEEEI